MQKRQQTPSPSENIIGAKSIKDGSLVEYTSTKGTKRLAIVSKRTGAYLDVLNDARKSFTVPISRVTYHINGSFAFGDLLRLNEILGDLKPIQVERLWESSFGQKHPAVCNLNYISKQIFGSTDAVRTFASMKLMSTYGTVFFEQVENALDGADDNNDEINGNGNGNGNAFLPVVPAVPGSAVDVVFVPLSPNAVQQNLRSRAALREFKQRIMKVYKHHFRTNRSRFIHNQKLSARIKLYDSHLNLNFIHTTSSLSMNSFLFATMLSNKLLYLNPYLIQ